MPTRVPRIAPSEITPPEAYFSRRALLTGALTGALAGALAGGVSAVARAAAPPPAGAALDYTHNARYSASEAPNKYEEITTYNNYYEFGTDKEDPSQNARRFRARPWSVSVAGEAEVRGNFTLEDILKGQALEERIYRFRCVEAWSLVVPWVGFPLSSLLARFKPTSRAKYVEFTTLYDPQQMPGQRFPVLNWPYVEGLRIDEAMHPLTLMVVGLYGRELPNQDGAPLRLIVPWKYGFKSIKSIVRIRFSDSQPRTAWNVATPKEYGFYANVNPQVDHPRWSQASERRIGAPFLAARRPTLLFNGYADEVASLYQGMDLRRNF
jgi:sulfoxide reductase catalytic subunit YedY